MGETASLKVPSLPSKPLQDTSRINGQGVRSSRSGGRLVAHHGSASAYQADLLKDLDKGQGLSPDEVANREKPISHQKKRTSACECL